MDHDFKVIPILRIFDRAKALDFYVGFLGMTLDWEHHFDETAPAFIQVSRGSLTLHLSEHHGDCCPGAAVSVAMTGLDALHAEVNGKGYRFMRPGIELQPWGFREMTVIDPSGNRLHFRESVAQGPASQDQPAG